MQVEELDISFDPVAFYQQLMRAAGKKDFPVAPNTLQNALQDKKSRIVVTTPRVRRVLAAFSVFFCAEYLFFFFFNFLVKGNITNSRGGRDTGSHTESRRREV